MSAAAIIARARALGVSLRVDGDKIKVKGSPPAVTQILPIVREHKPALLQALSPLATGPIEASGHWLISLPPERLERWFSPAVTRAELAKRYPGALLVALPDATEPPLPELLESLP